ncbi:MAG TPA: hypothetical protein VHP33_30525 [Polyangiaceae bacterium]|nr:hypothetical protein [Polyangiaceae bacterium]
MSEQRPLERGTSKLPKKETNPARELSPGEVLAIEYHGRWVAGAVVGRHVEGKRLLPVVELYRGSWASEPTLEALASVPARVVGPFLEAPHWRREPLALDGLELLGPVMPAALKVLGHATSLPDARGLPERGYRLVAARNLLYLLKTLQTPSLAPEQI